MKRYIAILVFIHLGCKTTRPVKEAVASQNITSNGKIFTSLFQQRAAEYQALCWQAFNTARLRLDAVLTTAHSKPLAIITDIDETLLDNSPYAVTRSLLGEDYEQKSWEEWTSLARADTLSGARSFLKYASLKGVKIFYVTNRTETERKGTLANLVKYDFPDAVNEHLILKGTVSSKESRRQKISEKYEIVLFMGDNLADFSVLFDKKTPEERSHSVVLMANEFGKKFILLPNPSYGDWETSLYQYKYNLTPAQKDSVIRKALKGY